MSDTDAISDPAHRAPDDDQLRADDPNVVSMLPACDVQQVRTDALRLIIRETIPASLPKEWEFIGKSDDVRQMAVEPHDVVTELRRDFDDEQLVMSRVLLARQGVLRLNRVFGGPGSKYLVKFNAHGQPIDAFSARGTLSVSGPSILPFARARRTPNPAAKLSAVLVATSDDDLQLLYRLGFQCAPAAGLSDLCGRVVEAILAAPNSAIPDYRYKLMIVVGSIAQRNMMPVAEVRKILAHLHRIESVYDRRPQGLFYAYWPDKSTHDKICDALTFRHRARFSLVFHEVLKSSIIGLNDVWDRLAQSEDTGLIGAHREVCEALASDNPINRQLGVRRALPRLQRHLAAATVDKFWQAAQMASDPIMSALYLECGDMLQKTNAENSLIVAAEKIAGFTSNLHARDHTVMDQRQRIDTLIKLHRALAPK